MRRSKRARENKLNCIYVLNCRSPANSFECSHARSPPRSRRSEDILVSDSQYWSDSIYTSCAANLFVYSRRTRDHSMGLERVSLGPIDFSCFHLHTTLSSFSPGPTVTHREIPVNSPPIKWMVRINCPLVPSQRASQDPHIQSLSLILPFPALPLPSGWPPRPHGSERQEIYLPVLAHPGSYSSCFASTDKESAKSCKYLPKVGRHLGYPVP